MMERLWLVVSKIQFITRKKFSEMSNSIFIPFLDELLFYFWSTISETRGASKHSEVASGARHFQGSTPLPTADEKLTICRLEKRRKCTHHLYKIRFRVLLEQTPRTGSVQLSTLPRTNHTCSQL